MRSVLVLFLLLGACRTEPVASASPPRAVEAARVHMEVPGDDPRIRIEGRAAASDRGPRFSWPGTSVHLRLVGTTIDVRLDDTPFDDEIEDLDTIGVRIDDAPMIKLALRKGEHSYRIAEGLSRTTHDIVLVKLTESEQGTITLRSIESDGHLVAARPARARRILAIGDSITAGYGIDGPEGCHYDAQFANASRTWLFRAADALGAERHVIAWSGRGLVWNYDRSLETTMATLATRTIGSEPASRHDPSAFVPDAIVVNLGTNDVSRPEYDKHRFAREYLALLGSLRTWYPEARIVVAYGPLMSDDYPRIGTGTLRKMRKTLEGVVARRTRAGDTNVRLLALPSAQGREGAGCDSHPSAATHERLAGLLVQALSDVW